MANGENQNPKPNPNPVEATPGAAARTITLKSADGEIFDVEEAVAMEFATVKSYFEDGAVSGTKPMPLFNVSGSALSRVITYCRRSLEIRSKIRPAADAAAEAVGEGDLEAEKAAKQERKEFEAEFLKDESNEDVKELILAANYLNIKELLDFLCRSVAVRIQNKSLEYLRKFFAIEGDYTLEEKEEEARIRREYAWAFEDVEED